MAPPGSWWKESVNSLVGILGREFHRFFAGNPLAQCQHQQCSALRGSPVLRQPPPLARRKRRRVVGEPRVRVILEWAPDEDDGQTPILGLEHC